MAKMTRKKAVDLPTTSTQEDIFAEVVNFFQTDGWQFTQTDGQTRLQTSCKGDNGTWLCYAAIRLEQQQFIFYSVCPVKAAENKRLAIAEFIARANSDMVIGNFEIDFTSGEIRYKTSMDFEGSKLSFTTIRKLVYVNVVTMDKYLKGIMSVICGVLSPVAAIELLENDEKLAD